MNPVMMRGGPGPGGYLHAANGLDQEELQALRFFKGEIPYGQSNRNVRYYYQSVLRIPDVYSGSRNRLFSIPDPKFSIPDPGSTSKTLDLLFLSPTRELFVIFLLTQLLNFRWKWYGMYFVPYLVMF
jgi:hypothetical protein